MRTSYLSILGVIGLLALQSALLAHPGHDHWQEATEILVEAPKPVPPSSTPVQFVFVAVVLGSLAVWGLSSGNNLYRLPAVLIPLALAVGVLLSNSVEASNIVEDRPQPKSDAKQLALLFENFKKDNVTARADDDYLYVESNAFPSHPLMVGIKAWQQQVPLPQPYTGKNAWRIPLKPVVSDKPISGKKMLYRGAIALAVNGVPIFNALNNRGEDAFLIGELDEYGGHCGKGDDYHYHAAPLHLEKLVGKGKPIAYALDGFPLYGLTDQKLDEFNGRFDEDGKYRYHSTKTYPYINGGMRGVVEVRNDGVEPQPRAAPLRQAQAPLRGAKITGFTVDAEKKNFSLKYELKGVARKIDYKVNADNTYTFTFVDEFGKEMTETYTRREGKGKGKKDDKKGDEKKKKGPGGEEKK